MSATKMRLKSQLRNRANRSGKIPKADTWGCASGGTHAGDGALFDVVRLVAGGGQSSSVSSLGEGDDAERGVSPGTYYFIFESIHAQASTGVFKMHWEERP